jgi:hypothetical protein
MERPRDWSQMREMITGLLERRTGAGIDEWNRRVAQANPADERSLRQWLTDQGVDGYPRMLLVMERFGYPDYMLKGANQLVEEQYADRPALRPILDAVTATAVAMGEVDVQARKTYVSFVTPRRAFAVVRPTTRTRVDLGLRLPDEAAAGRMKSVPRGVGQDAFVRAIELTSVDEVDDYVAGALERAYRASS